MERGNGHLPSRRHYFSICILEHWRTFRIKPEVRRKGKRGKFASLAYFMTDSNVKYFKNKFKIQFTNS